MVSERLVSVNGLVKRIPLFTESMVRWWIFNADRNGLNQALIKIGSRVYIDIYEFDAWLENQRVTTK